jgi:hypothetical protein
MFSLEETKFLKRKFIDTFKTSVFFFVQFGRKHFSALRTQRVRFNVRFDRKLYYKTVMLNGFQHLTN